MPSMP